MLVLGGDTPVLGVPTVAGASVAVEVLDHKRGPKVIAFKKRRRKNSRRKRGYRHDFSVIRIFEILTDGKKASDKAPPRPKREVKPKAEAAPEKKSTRNKTSAERSTAATKAKSGGKK